MISKPQWFLIGWIIALAGFVLFLWQTVLGGRSNFWLDVGVVMLIAGTVLRLYARFEYGKKKPKSALRRRPPDSSLRR